MGPRQTHTHVPRGAQPPRWTLLSTLGALIFTLGIYVLLPAIGRLAQQPNRDRTVRTVEFIAQPPPPPPPRKVQREQDPVKKEPPRPKLDAPRKQLPALRAALQLDMVLGDVGGDFDLGFQIATPNLVDEVRNMVFELEDLDEPPRPLLRLQPVYPPRARMRRQQGYVIVEFVVDAQGATRDIKVVSSVPSDVFDQASVNAVQRWKFKAGQRGNKAVAVRVRQKVQFSLD